MHLKLALVLSIAALAAANVDDIDGMEDIDEFYHRDPPDPNRNRDDPDFDVRCPLRMGGDRRISSDFKLFTSCTRADREPDPDDLNASWVWGEFDLGRCIGNDDGAVAVEKMGNLQEECSECKFDGKRTSMICTCPDEDGEFVESKLELKDVLKVTKEGQVCCKDWDDICGKEFNPEEYHSPNHDVPWGLGPYRK